MAVSSHGSEDHTVRSFDGELAHLADMIARMGGLAEAQLAAVLRAVSGREAELAARVVGADPEIDRLEQEIYAWTVRLLALRQPLAQDLRTIVSALKVSGELERIADYAANIAKRTIVLIGLPTVEATAGIPRLGRVVQEMIHDVLDAYVQGDVDKALAVRQRDGEVDAMYTSLVRELIATMIDDPRTITACTHLMFMAKNIERIGDHATNIAEMLYYLVRGTTLKDARPKDDRTTAPDPDGEA
jgi:phosphate transport system protein